MPDKSENRSDNSNRKEMDSHSNGTFLLSSYHGYGNVSVFLYVSSSYGYLKQRYSRFEVFDKQFSNSR